MLNWYKIIQKEYRKMNEKKNEKEIPKIKEFIF